MGYIGTPPFKRQSPKKYTHKKPGTGTVNQSPGPRKNIKRAHNGTYKKVNSPSPLSLQFFRHNNRVPLNESPSKKQVRNHPMFTNNKRISRVLQQVVRQKVPNGYLPPEILARIFREIRGSGVRN
jgi:hypothetical protein